MNEYFQNVAIVTDLDGTFFGDKAALVARNIEAIRRFCKEGGTFTYATGRDSWILEYIFPDAGNYVNCPAVLCCGSYLYDFSTKAVYDEVHMDQEEALFVFDQVLSRYPQIGLRIGTFKGYVTPRVTEYMASFFQKFPVFLEGDLQNFRCIPWHKAVFVSPPELKGEVYEFCKTIPLESLTLTTSASSLVEFVPKAAGKGNGIKKLKRFLGGKTMICVGDQDNDLDMLRACDVPACPSNAIESVKNASRIRLCDHNEGCIADLIEKLPLCLS